MTGSNTSDISQSRIVHKDVDQLLLDDKNPRFGDHESNQEQREILDHIVDTFGVDDVLSSLAVNGYFESEPLVCEKSNEDDSKFVVKEGNRRLSACLIILGDNRASGHEKRTGKFRKIWKEHEKPRLNPIPVIVFPSKDPKILSYLGVRHIASTQPWDSYAKASWVARVVEQERLSISEISTMIGDNHKTINRMLEGYYFIQQLMEAGVFQPEDSIRKGRGSVSEYPFSWMYTMLGYKTVRDFLEIPAGAKDATPKPLPEENLEKGVLLLKSMFGSRSQGRSAAINDSRELGILAKVFSDQEKIRLLQKGKNVDEIEDLSQPIEKQLADGLGQTKDILRHLIGRLAEHGISQDVAQGLAGDSSGNKKLATQLDRQIQNIAFENEGDE